ncbi:MAG: twin-arginine translocation signal domain-containing protein [Candidatus Staskawiczbacteria bacterium]|nr:twin-arginine translocation signal domain-containing protein [Candidatus Staskawiczbacteria bacterium]
MKNIEMNSHEQSEEVPKEENNKGNKISRRGFLKAVTAIGIVAGVPGCNSEKSSMLDEPKPKERKKEEDPDVKFVNGLLEKYRDVKKSPDETVEKGIWSDLEGVDGVRADKDKNITGFYVKAKSKDDPIVEKIKEQIRKKGYMTQSYFYKEDGVVLIDIFPNKN